MMKNRRRRDRLLSTIVEHLLPELGGSDSSESPVWVELELRAGYNFTRAVLFHRLDTRVTWWLALLAMVVSALPTKNDDRRDESFQPMTD